VCAVIRDNNLIGLVWLDNKPANFLAHLTHQKLFQSQGEFAIGWIPATETVARYNRFMGDVDQHM